MVTISKKKGVKIIEAPPQVQAPKPQPELTPAEFTAATLKAQAEGGTAPSLNNLPAVTYGKLKPEYQRQENIAVMSEKQGVLGQQGDVFGAREIIEPKGFEIPIPFITPIEKWASENAGQPVKAWPAITATIKGMMEGLGVNIRGLGVTLGTDPATKANSVMNAAIEQYKLTGTEFDAQELLKSFDEVEQYLVQEQGYTKIRADAKKLIDGKQTLDEYEIKRMMNKVNSNRIATAGLIRGNYNKQIAGLSDEYRPGAGGK